MQKEHPQTHSTMKNSAKMAVGAVHLYPALQEQLQHTAVAIGDSQHGGSPIPNRPRNKANLTQEKRMKTAQNVENQEVEGRVSQKDVAAQWFTKQRNKGLHLWRLPWQQGCSTTIGNSSQQTVPQCCKPQSVTHTSFSIGKHLKNDGTVVVKL